MTIKVAIYNRPYSYDVFHLPLLRLMLETYYNEQGAHPDKVKWLYPHDYKKEEELKAAYLADNPDIVGISTYVWNIDQSVEFARWVKENLPNAVVIIGGPGVELIKTDNFFIEHPYVDCLADPLLYGEWFFLDLIDQYAVSRSIDWTDIQGACYRHPTKNVLVRSTKYRDSRTFNFTEASIYGYAWLTEYVRSLTEDYSKIGHLDALIETTRGCPYQCSFCEWGVGDRRKVIAKSMSTIEKEITDLARLGVVSVRIIDANFGILKRDLEVIQLVGEKICAPNPDKIEVAFSGLSKNNKKHIYQIYEILHRYKARLRYFKLSIQDVDRSVLDVNKRADLPLEENFALAESIRRDFGLKFMVERILGLPGKTLESSYLDYDTLFKFMPDDHRASNAFILLKGTPASTPEFMEKYKINANFKISKDAMGNDLVPTEVYEKEGGYFDGAVLETSSYTREEWFLMFLTDQYYLALISKGILSDYIAFITQRYDVKLSAFLKQFIENLATSSNSYAQSVWKHFAPSLDQLYQEKFPLFVDSPRAGFKCPYFVIFTYYCLADKKGYMDYVHECMLACGVDDYPAIEFYTAGVPDKEYNPEGPARIVSYEGQTLRYEGQAIPNFTIWWHTDPESLLWASVDFRLNIRLKAS